MMKRLNLTPAIGWSLIATALSSITGPVAAVIITRNFTLEYQGYYYTFYSLMALSVFLELGFTTCLVQFISHEFSHLKFTDQGQLAGDKSHLDRILGLAHLSFRWFFVGSLLALVFIGFGGEIFFRHTGLSNNVEWRLGWWLLCFASSINLLVTSAQAILDGINQVAWNSKLRLCQNFVKMVLLLGLLFVGARLLAPGIAALTVSLVSVLCLRRWRPLFTQIIQSANAKKTIPVSWVREIFPMQWRIAISWACGYFIFSALTPLVFSNFGPETAGRFGLTWTIVQSMSGIGYIFISTRAPQFGMLASSHSLLELRKIWKTSLFQSTAVVTLASITYCLGYAFVSKTHPQIASRVLDFSVTYPLLLAAILNQFVSSVAVLARSEKREPFLVASVIGAILILVGTLVSCRYFGVVGITWNYFFGTVLGAVMALNILKYTIAFKGFSNSEHGSV